MRISYPKSFFKLLLFGFALSTLPLIIALWNTIHYIRQAEQSLHTVAETVTATRNSRELVDQLTQMERSARQYFSDHDRLYQRSYLVAQEKFNKSIAELAKIPRIRKENVFNEIQLKEAKLTQEIMTLAPESIPHDQFFARFMEISNKAHGMLTENNRLINLESALLAETAEHTKKMVFWQAIILIPVALLVMLLITFLIAKPIRRMDAAINRLGEGEYTEPISIDGPGDLRSLGERLDWLRTQLELLEQQKQRFLRHVSHELKTPLTAIREASELLRDGVGGTLSEQQQEIIGILRESSLRLQKMIENLLSYTAIKFQKPQLKIQAFSLTEMVEEIINNYALTLASKQISVQRYFQPVNFTNSAAPSNLMKGDKEKIHTVIDNLISNALKFSPQNGHIRISIYPWKISDASPEFEQRAANRINTAHSSNFVIIEVHDDGPGVTKNDRAYLFNPFYIGSRNYESLVSGSGLGLSIAKEYVNAHGGDITLLSPEHGAQFRVRLPLETKIEVLESQND